MRSKAHRENVLTFFSLWTYERVLHTKSPYGPFEPAHEDHSGFRSYDYYRLEKNPYGTECALLSGRNFLF